MALSHLLSSVGTHDLLYNLFFYDSSSLPDDPSEAVPSSVVSLD